MDKIQKAAALRVFLNLASITAIVIGIRVLIELAGLQVFALLVVSGIGLYLVKFMYDIEVDRARRLEELNNRDRS
jgi:hypothetical protein